MDKERQLRQALVKYGAALVESGLVQGTWGNLSARLDDRYMLVTPSGLDYRRLTAGDMVKVELGTLSWSGSLKPTSESGIHSGVYSSRPEIGAVIHTHSKYCSIFAAAEKPVPVIGENLTRIFGSRVELAAYGAPGSRTLWENTLDALGKNRGCIMAHHGMLCVGSTMESAFEACRLLEDYCRTYIEERMAQTEKGNL